MKKIQFFSEVRAMGLVPFDDTAVISITTPGRNAPLKEGWRNLLRLQFDDVTRENAEGMTEFSQDMAERVLSFVGALPKDVDRIYIHCHAGISRSAAVAKFLCERFDLPFSASYTSYNKDVFLHLRAAQEQKNKTSV